jgi:general secretion pathway protein F
LVWLGGDLPGRLGRLAITLGQRLEAGENLPQALERETDLPPAYRAVVSAGLRSGRLSAAVEGVSSVIRRAAETRRMVLAAWVYPLFVAVLAYGLFLFTVLKCQPVILAAYDGILQQPQSLAGLRWLIRTAPLWAPWFPVLLAVGWGGWWLHARSAWTLDGGGRSLRGWRRFSLTALRDAGRMGTFADCLALLIEHAVPLPEAVTLAADASGDQRLRAAGHELATRLAGGETGVERLAVSGMPPLLMWLLAAPPPAERFVRILRRMAATYQRRARWIARWLSVFLPLGLTTTVGTAAVLLYAVSLVAPWSRMLFEMAQP